jgi:hypothetical protein
MINQRFVGIEPSTGEEIKGKMLSRAGKVGKKKKGKYKNRYNVLLDD